MPASSASKVRRSASPSSSPQAPAESERRRAVRASSLRKASSRAARGRSISRSTARASSRVTDARGRRYYTRDGEFSRFADGTLRNSHDLRLATIVIPLDAVSATVAPDGTVKATFSGATHAIGRIRLVEFSAPEHLRSVDGALFEATGASGKPREVVLGGDEGPKLHFGMLEESNVTVIDAMMQILVAQRAYEANAKGVQAADEMLRIANNLQRG